MTTKTTLLTGPYQDAQVPAKQARLYQRLQLQRDRYWRHWHRVMVGSVFAERLQQSLLYA